MANLARVLVTWAGVPVTGGGISSFFFDEAHEGFQADVAAFLTAVTGLCPAGLAITVPTSGDLVDIATGALTGTWSEGSGTVINTSSGVAYAAGVGMRTTWRTNGIRNGRRVVGSTFLVPLVTSAYQTDGTIVNATREAVQAAAEDLVVASGANMKIWSRPVNGSGGQASTVLEAVVPDKVSWLRSRRT
jgi:hypothetical protein